MAQRIYLLKKRGKYWQYRLANEKTFHSVNSLAKKLNYTDKITSKAKAENIVLKFIQEKDHIKISSQSITLSDYINQKSFFIWNECHWIKRQHKLGKRFSEEWSRQRRSHLVNYIVPRFGSLLIEVIEGIEVENWLLQLEFSNQLKRHIKNSFSIVLKEAARDKYIKANPLDIVELGKITPKKQEVLTSDELQKLFPKDNELIIKVWGNLYKATMFLLMVTSGMRSQEIRALKWSDIIWNVGVWIKKAVKANNKIGKTKNEEERSLFLPSRTLELLSLFRQESSFPSDTNFIFYGIDKSTPIGRRSMLLYLKDTIKKIYPNLNKNITVRSLRHTYRTLVGKTLSLQLIKEQMGHKSDKVSNMYNKANALERIEKYQTERDKLEAVFNL